MRTLLSVVVVGLVFGACGGGGGPLLLASETRTRTTVIAAPTGTPTPAATTPTAPTMTPTRTAPTSTPVLAGISCQWADVVEVEDGDTLTARFDGGATEPVRLIGVDAPEAGAPLFDESRAALLSLARERVCLERDQTDRDSLDRLLRYAWREDGTLLNEALVEQGMAIVVTFPPDVKYLATRYQPAEARARAASAGLWAAAPTAAAGAAGDCDPSYPDFCIPPASVVGDLDCPDIGRKRFTVLPPDPHGFDGNNDGVGCES